MTDIKNWAKVNIEVVLDLVQQKHVKPKTHTKEQLVDKLKEVLEIINNAEFQEPFINADMTPAPKYSAG